MRRPEVPRPTWLTRRRACVLALTAVAVLGVGWGMAAMLGGWEDPLATEGSYEGLVRPEVTREAKGKVDSSSMEISCAAAMRVREGETTVEARLENPASNHVDQRVRIYTRERPDDILYQSGALAPGQTIETIELAHPLEPGRHDAIVEFQGYERHRSLVSNQGELLGHDAFGASCAAEVPISCVAK